METLSVTTTEVVKWQTAKGNINTARRFLRLFKWIDCFNAAQAQFLLASTGPAVSQQTSSSEKPPKTAATVKQPEVDSTKALLGGLKFSLLGIYLFMEMFVITDAIAITATTWSGTVQVEALKIWGYSLLVSIVLGVYELRTLPSPVPTSISSTEKTTGTATDNESEAHKLNQATRRKRRAIYKQLAADATDFVIPVWVAHWYPVDALTVGIAGSINGLLGAHSAWERVNG